MAQFLDTMPTMGNQSKIPSDLHMMQHVYRSKIYEERLRVKKAFGVKSIFNTDTALTLTQHNHHLCLDGVIKCRQIIVDPNLAQTNHYRKGCVSQKLCDESKENLVKDTRVWRHLQTVINNTNFAFENIFSS